MTRLRLFGAGLAMCFLAMGAIAPAAVAAIAMGEHVQLKRGEAVQDDFLAMGNTVRLLGDVTGDVLAMAQRLDVDGTIAGDLFALAQYINATGTVRGSSRLLAQSLTVAGRVERSLTAFGESVELAEDGQVGGNMLAGGAAVRVLGAVGGRLRSYAELTVIDGTVVGDVDVEGNRLELGPRARVTGRIKYVGREPAQTAPGAVLAGGITFVQRAEASDGTAAGRRPGLGARLLALLKSASFAAVLVWLCGGPVGVVVDVLARRPLPSLGAGCLATTLVGPVFVLAMVTVLGQPFGWLAVTVFGAAYALAALSFRVLFGSLLGGKLAKRFGWNLHPVAAALLGVTLLGLLTQVPVLGGILAFTGVVLVTGALFILLKEALGRASVDVGQ
ncbi:MAG: polymer-forming cytoskeletal protein [Bacillota bacterium]